MSNRKVRKAKTLVEKTKQEMIVDELARINSQYGGLKPSIVVEEATPESSPIHSEFEWDDESAGFEYRLIQARKLIRVVVPTITGKDGAEIKDPYVWVPATGVEKKDAGSGEGVYRPMSVVIMDTDAFARALSALVSKMNAAILAAEELRDAATGGNDGERMAKIAMAITALQTASAAVSALH